MNTEFSVEELLSWRTAQAENEAPSAPSACRLLRQVRPWWESAPEVFRGLVSQLDALNVRFGHAADGPAARGSGYPVPTLIAQTNAETGSLADVLYIHLNKQNLKLRFRLHDMPEEPDSPVEVTFVTLNEAQVLFAAQARLAPGGEYRLEVEVPEHLALSWSTLKVTDRMPFRFILRSIRT
jgi:hypothetical protein